MEFVIFDTRRISYVTMKYNAKQGIAGHNFAVIPLCHLVGASVTQRYEERQSSDANASIPNADAFVRLVNKIAAQATRRELVRQAEEAHQTRRRGRVRVRFAGRADALYIISIAAKLADMHPQTLRKYDREGLVSPSRTQGSRRLYSDEDLERLQIVRRLSEDLGLNLSGVGLVLELVQHMRGMLDVLENSEDLTNSPSAKAVADEIKVILHYLGVE